MAKTIFILIDGCGNKLAKENMGFLEHMAETAQAARYRVRGELPSMSRPLYETLLTGLKVGEHGIFSNIIDRGSNCESIFSLCRKNDLTTAASAYYWVSELYNRSPFDRAADRLQFGSGKCIQNGMFYFEDPYPDSHVFCDAAYLLSTYAPDFLMIHTMNIDDTGHIYGDGSKQQAVAALKLDTALSSFLPLWKNMGYEILVTSDHSMNALGLHGGNTDELRDLPLYLFSEHAPKGVFEQPILSQLYIAPLLCRLLEIAPAEGMLRLEDCEVKLLG